MIYVGLDGKKFNGSLDFAISFSLELKARLSNKFPGCKINVVVTDEEIIIFENAYENIEIGQSIERIRSELWNDWDF